MTVADVLPINATSLERNVIEAAMSAFNIHAPLRDLWNPDRCPVEFLPHLAAFLSVDAWSEAWAEDKKRNVIKASAEVHRHKGTVGAVKLAVRAAGLSSAKVIERFGWQFADGTHLADGSVTGAPASHWAEYQIRLSAPITITQGQEARDLIEAVAPACCELVALDFTETNLVADGSVIADGTYSAGVA